MKGINYVPCVTGGVGRGGVMAEGKGLTQQARNVPAWFLGLDTNLP